MEIKPHCLRFIYTAHTNTRQAELLALHRRRKAKNRASEIARTSKLNSRANVIFISYSGLGAKTVLEARKE